MGTEGFEPSSAGIFFDPVSFGTFVPVMRSSFPPTKLCRMDQRSRYLNWSPLGCQVTPHPHVEVSISVFNQKYREMKASKHLNIEKIKRDVEARKKISNEAFLDMMGELIELKGIGVKNASSSKKERH